MVMATAFGICERETGFSARRQPSRKPVRCRARRSAERSSPSASRSP
jgi:hypothetical protein